MAKYSLKLVSASSQGASAADSSYVSQTGACTFEAWIKKASDVPNGEDKPIVAKWITSGDQRSYTFRLMYEDASNERLNIAVSNDGTGAGVESISSDAFSKLSLNTWYHVAVTFNPSGNVKFYINGSQTGATKTTTKAAIYDSTASLTIGYIISGYYFDGRVTDVRVWSDVRSDSEISNNYITQLSGKESNLEAYWRMDNILTDDTQHGNTLSTTGSPKFIEDSPYASWNTNSIKVVKTSSQYLEAADSSSLTISEDLTVEFWVKKTSGYSGSGGIVAKWNGDSDKREWMALLDGASGELQFTNSSTGANSGLAQTGFYPTVDKWYHIAIAYDASAGSIDWYKDGVFQATITGTLLTSIYNSDTPLWIGKYNVGTAQYFDGYVDDVRIWGDIRTATEIRENFYKQLAGNETDLKAYWTLNNNYLDRTANGNTLTPQNSPQFSTDIAFNYGNGLYDDFETYSAGDLQNQGGWVGSGTNPGYWDVSTSNPHSGSNCARVTLAGSDGGAYKNWSIAQDTGSLVLWFRVASSGSDNNGVHFAGAVDSVNSKTIAAIYCEYGGSKNLKYYSNSSWVSWGTYTDDTWHKVKYEWRISDGKVQYTLDDGTPTGWVTAGNTGWVSANRSSVHHESTACTGYSYLDDISGDGTNTNFRNFACLTILDRVCTFEDKFNSDTKSIAELDGQDGWTMHDQIGTARFYVVDNIPKYDVFEGNQGVKITSNITSATYIKNTFSAATRGSIYCSVKSDTTANALATFSISEVSTAVANAALSTDGYIYFQGSQVATYSANQWYIFNIEWDTFAQANKVRFRYYNGIDWSSWGSWVSSTNSFTSVNRVDLSFDSIQAGTPIGWFDNITVTNPIFEYGGLQDFTGYNEVDPDGDFTITSHKINVSSLSYLQTSYVDKSFGTGYFDRNFKHYVEFYVDLTSTSQGHHLAWALSNTEGSYQQIIDASGDGLFLRVQHETNSVQNMYVSLSEVISGSQTISDGSLWADYTIGTLYYATIRRDETVGTYGTLYCDIYTSSADRDAGTNAIASYDIALTAKRDFRYLYGIMGRDTSGTDYPTAGYIQNLYLAGPTELTFACLTTLVQTNNTYSLDFETSSSQYLSAASDTSTDITGDITLECWIKMEQLPSTANMNYGLINKKDHNVWQNGYTFQIQKSNDKVLAVYYGTTNDATTRVEWNMDSALTSADVGKWIHLAAVADVSAKTWTFYKNGQPAAGSSLYTGVSTAIGASGIELDISGVYSNGSVTEGFVDGMMDEIRIWAVARTAAEIAANYNTQLNTTDSNLRAYYRFNNDRLDQTSNNNDLTDHNGTTFRLGEVPFNADGFNDTYKPFACLTNLDRPYVYSQNFNSLSTAALSGQDGWSTTESSWQVEESVKFEGTKGVIVNYGNTLSEATKTITLPCTSGSVSVAMMSTENAADTILVNLNILSDSTSIGRIRMSTTSGGGGTKIFSIIGTTLKTGWNENQWYYAKIEWDYYGHPNQLRNWFWDGTTWYDSGWENALNNFSSINKVVLGYEPATGYGGSNTYFDTLTSGDPVWETQKSFACYTSLIIPENTKSLKLVESSNQYAYAADHSSLDITGDLTIEAWFKLASDPYSASHYYGIAGKHNGSSGISYLLSIRSGVYEIFFGTSSDGTTQLYDTIGVDAWVLNQWYHVAVSYDASAGTAELYLDGVWKGQMTGLATSLYNSTTPFIIGARGASWPSTWDWMDGKIDEVRIFAEARTQTAIQESMRSRAQGNSGVLRGAWSFGNETSDSSGYGNTLTFGGGAGTDGDTPFPGHATFATFTDFDNARRFATLTDLERVTFVTFASKTDLEEEGKFLTFASIVNIEGIKFGVFATETTVEEEGMFKTFASLTTVEVELQKTFATLCVLSPRYLDPVRNFAKCTVSTGYDASATTVVLSSGHGAKLPNPSTDGKFNLVWYNSSTYVDPSDDPNVEIVRVQSRSSDTLTVTRGEESTTPSTKNAGGCTYKMILTITKKMIDDIGAAIQVS